MVRLADVPARTETERLQLAQAALNRYDELLSRWQNEPQAAEDVIRARVDRLGALHAHGDYPQVIREYQALTSAQHPVPTRQLAGLSPRIWRRKMPMPPSRFSNVIQTMRRIRRTTIMRFSTPAGYRAVSGRSPVC